MTEVASASAGVSRASHYAERIYAGTLGKIIGVYFGRPVEGWTYPAIRDRFDMIEYFVAGQLDVPLIVPDDDISGSFVFFRALEDTADLADLDARAIGQTWLNYVVEGKTVLWWGGLSRSTEHSAFLRLKSGIDAPASGSERLNGRSMAEQIGAEIFIDPWGMVNPGDPERAVAMARQAASVSHDGLAVDAACLIAAMEALAFDERDLQVLLPAGLSLVGSERLRRLDEAVIDQCRRADDWRSVRDWIETNHGYAKYPGNCPIATNHAAVVMALLTGGDNFQRSISIAASAGWDTDCNAGNVGCLNGIRLGLEGTDAGADLRTPLADRLYVVSADGGECISDAVREARKIIHGVARIDGEPVEPRQPRYRFEFPGSTQGFTVHPGSQLPQAPTRVYNSGSGLAVAYTALAPGVRAAVSAPTFADPAPTGAAGTSYFEVVGSPSLYPSQTVRVTLRALGERAPEVALFVETYGDDGVIMTIRGLAASLRTGVSETLEWDVPDTGARPIYRLGLELTSAVRLDGVVEIEEVDWTGAPADFVLGRADELSPLLTPWTTDTVWLRTFVSSATHFAPDYTTTFSISHVDLNGVVTTGTRDWDDYSVSSTITFNEQEGAGLVGRARGHRRYYAAILRDGKATIVKRRDDSETVLADAPFAYRTDECHLLEFRLRGETLELLVDGELHAVASDRSYASGGAGFVVHRGAILADGFRVRRL